MRRFACLGLVTLMLLALVVPASTAQGIEGTLEAVCNSSSVGPGSERSWENLSEESSRVATIEEEVPIGYEVDIHELQELKSKTFGPSDSIPVAVEDSATFQLPGARAQPQSSAPSLFRNFEGLDDKNQPDGWVHRPPDPHIASGEAHLGVMVNSELAFYTKDGTLVEEASFASWWSNVISAQAHEYNLFDPRIAYDHHAGRWLMVCLAKNDDLAESYYLLSVSQTSDPTGDWWNWKLDGNFTYSGMDTYADYPDLGFDDISPAAGGAIYITANQFTFPPYTTFKTVMLNVLPKNALYSGSAFDYYYYYDLVNIDDSKVFTLRTAHTFGNPGKEYFINTKSAGWDKVTLWSVVPHFPYIPTLSRQATITIGSYSMPPNAEQKGGSQRLDTICNRVYNCMYRNGYLYAAFTEAYDWGNGTVAAIRYLKINTNTDSADINERYGEDGYYYWFPAIYTDGLDNIVMVFARSSATEYAGIRYTGRRLTDTTMQPSVLLKAGETYIPPGTGQTVARWGDYFGIANDPAATNKVWVYGEWAKDCPGISSEWDWGTWIGEVMYHYQYDLTISVVGSGTTDPAVGVHTYIEGTIVHATAYPDSGWKFDHWELDGVGAGSDNPIEVTMNADHSLVAFFTELPSYGLTISVVGSGTTVPTPGSHTYYEGTSVDVTAIPNVGWKFDHWELDGVGAGSDNPIEVTMNNNHALTAFFVERDRNMDVLRFEVVRSPTAQVLAMQTGLTHVLPSLSAPMDLWSTLLAEEDGGLIRTADVTTLNTAGFTIIEALAFHVCSIVYNIRDDQSYRRSDVSYWPLKDAEFRHALIHCYDQLAIIPPIYGFIVTPVRSLVPPAQSRYFNTAVPMHPFNPGDPFTSPPGEHSACGILKAAGYTFVDRGGIGVVDNADYWECPDGSPLPQMIIWTPLLAARPTSFTHCTRFVADLATIGLAATTANGQHGLINQGATFDWYLSKVFDDSDFDAFMVCWDVNRFPDQLYLLLHSSQDSLSNPGSFNAAGVNDATIDALAETLKFSLDVDDIETAAKEIQERLYDPTLPNADNFALAYMMLYSRSHFSAYSPDLNGIVRSPGYGPDNKWTFLNIRWTPGTERILPGNLRYVAWTLGDQPDSFNPLYADTKYEWEIIARVYDGLLTVNPYNHKDVPWIATGWEVVETAVGMDVTYYLRDDVFWQDGYQYTAYDAEFSLEFIRDWQIPRYREAWEHILDVEVINNYMFTVHCDERSLLLVYDWAYLAAMLPPQVWNRAWSSQQAILGYDPTEPYNVAPGYVSGPTPPPTNLFGTGPWIFQFYNPVTESSDLLADEEYFLTKAEIQNLKTEMFWEVGDYNRDGIINVADLVFVCFAFGSYKTDPTYDADADFNSDDWVNIEDVYNCAYHLLWQREYP